MLLDKVKLVPTRSCPLGSSEESREHGSAGPRTHFVTSVPGGARAEEPGRGSGGPASSTGSDRRDTLAHRAWDPKCQRCDLSDKQDVS